MTKVKWEKSEDEICPKCNQSLQQLIVLDFDEWDEEQEYVKAERCITCRWIADFDADPIRIKRY